MKPIKRFIVKTGVNTAAHRNTYKFLFSWSIGDGDAYKKTIVYVPMCDLDEDTIDILNWVRTNPLDDYDFGSMTTEQEEMFDKFQDIFDLYPCESASNMFYYLDYMEVSFYDGHGIERDVTLELEGN